MEAKKAREFGTLTVTREDGESVRIGPDVTVTVTKVKNDRRRTKLQIKAPLDVKILRAELDERKG